MAKEKRAFLLKNNWIEIFDNLSDKQAGVLIKSLFHYNVNGEKPGSLTDVEVNAYFNVMALECNVMNENYDRRCDTSAANGKLGGRPKGSTSCNNEEKPKKPNSKPKKPNNPNDIRYDMIGYDMRGDIPPSPVPVPLTLDECRQELEQDEAWLETFAMNNHLPDTDTVREWIGKFFAQLQNEGVTDKSPRDAKSHFARWYAIRAEKQRKEDNTDLSSKILQNIKNNQNRRKQ